MTASDKSAGLENLRSAHAQQVGPVRAAILLLGLPIAMLDELVLETFVMAHGRGEDLSQPAQARARLCVLALRVADSFRDEVPADAPRVSYGVPGGTVLSLFLDELRDRRREIFMLAEVGGLRVAEISAELGLGFEAVRVAMVELARDFTAGSAGAQSDEVIQRWIAANQLESAALAADWQRIAARVDPKAAVSPPVVPAGPGWPVPVMPPVLSDRSPAIPPPPVLSAPPVLGGPPGLVVPPVFGAPPVLGGPPVFGAPPVLGGPPIVGAPPALGAPPRAAPAVVPAAPVLPRAPAPGSLLAALSDVVDAAPAAPGSLLAAAQAVKAAEADEEEAMRMQPIPDVMPARMKPIPAVMPAPAPPPAVVASPPPTSPFQAPPTSPFQAPPTSPFQAPPTSPFAGPPAPFAPPTSPFAGPPVPFAPAGPGGMSLGPGADAGHSGSAIGTMPAAPSGSASNTFSGEVGRDNRDFDARPDRGIRRTSPWFYVAPLVLLLAGAAVWWFVLRVPPVEVVEEPPAPEVPAPEPPAPEPEPPAPEPVPAPVEPVVAPPTTKKKAGKTVTSKAGGGSGGGGASKAGGGGSKPLPEPEPKPAPKQGQGGKADAGQVIMELEMLSAAKKSLAGNPGQALAYVEQHNRDFPSSQLTDKFDEVKIKALCGLGRGSQARTEANAILKKRPGSLVGSAIKECKS